MSFYATIQGTVTYKDNESLMAVVDDLKKNGWLNDNGKFVDENGFVCLETDTPAFAEKTLHIPCCHYRNLAGQLDQITKDTTGTIVWSSTDGCFSGGVIEDGVEKTYDLKEWAIKNGDEEEDIPNQEEEFDAYLNWMDLVEQDFHATFI